MGHKNARTKQTLSGVHMHTPARAPLPTNAKYYERFRYGKGRR